MVGAWFIRKFFYIFLASRAIGSDSWEKVFQVNRLPLRAWIEVDLGRLESNVRKIKASLPEGVKYICVVKADAYGHSMPQSLVRFLNGGADIFAVANLYEASRVREVVSNRPVLVLSPILKEERPLCFDYDATPAVSSYAEAAAFDALAGEAGRKLNIQIKVDSGMGRSGVWFERADEEISPMFDLKNLRVSGMFTHLSSADIDPFYTMKQVSRFREIALKYGREGMLIHLHNSAAYKYVKVDPPFNAVRTGLLQYGINPYNDKSGYENLGLLPVLSFKSRITSVGRRNGRRLASVGAGYADGVPSGFTSDARVLVGGIRCPMMGAINLDESLVCVDAVPNAKVGDEVTFIGRQGDAEIDLCDYSRWTSRIPWESMVAIPRRVARILKD